MARYLVTYHGGGMPEDDEGRQAAMAAFGAWVASVGDALVDPGAPLGNAITVSPNGASMGPAIGPPGGWSVLQASDLQAAADLVASHPYVQRGGSLQISEAIAP